MSTTNKVTVELSIEEARALLRAIEPAAWMAQGKGDDARSDIYWDLFHRIQKLQFYDVDAEMQAEIDASLHS